MVAQVGTNAQFKCGVNRNDLFVKSQKANLQMDAYGSSFNPTPYLYCSHGVAVKEIHEALHDEISQTILKAQREKTEAKLRNLHHCVTSPHSYTGTKCPSLPGGRKLIIFLLSPKNT